MKFWMCQKIKMAVEVQELYCQHTKNFFFFIWGLEVSSLEGT